MSYNPTPDQALLLFGLLAVHGECAQAELMPAVKKADREALEKAKLIGVSKLGRSFYLRLEDAGWNWYGTNFSAPLPPAQRAFQEMLGRIGEHLAKSGETLAEFIGNKPETKAARQTKPAKKKAELKPASAKSAKAETSSKRKTSPKPRATGAEPKASSEPRKKPAKPKAPSPAALRKRIETEYLSLTGGHKNESVRLAHLRNALPDLDRATLDAALGRILKGDKTASLMRHDDPNQLDQADHAAAFSPAGEPFHVIWIAS